VQSGRNAQLFMRLRIEYVIFNALKR